MSNCEIGSVSSHVEKIQAKNNKTLIADVLAAISDESVTKLLNVDRFQSKQLNLSIEKMLHTILLEKSSIPRVNSPSLEEVAGQLKQTLEANFRSVHSEHTGTGISHQDFINDCQEAFSSAGLELHKAADGTPMQPIKDTAKQIVKEVVAAALQVAEQRHQENATKTLNDSGRGGR
jgi:hypothetical protein